MRVVPFARIRDIVGAPRLERALPEAATVADLWQALAAEFPALAELAASTRLVRGGTFVDGGARLRDGDEVCLLPPFGGG